MQAAKMNQLHDLIDIDLNFYRENHDDLQELSDADLTTHYFEAGYREGRVAHPLAERKHLVASLEKAKTLEIGPWATPLLRHDQVKYLDVMSKQELLERAEKTGFKYDEAVEIDFVSRDGSLSVVDEKFEIVMSSHNLEHQPDLISHLNEVSSVLETYGRYVMIVPNAMYCFDADLPRSKISEIFNAHNEKREAHTLGSVIEHSALTTHNDCVAHWQDKGKGEYKRLGVERIRNAIAAFNSAEGAYIDVHAWQFEPYSLSDILGALIKLGYIDFRKVSCRGPVHNTFEFTLELFKSDERSPVWDKKSKAVKPVMLPQDFDAKTYLDLHPDVFAAGIAAEDHYISQGIKEGRAYKRPHITETLVGMRPNLIRRSLTKLASPIFSSIEFFYKVISEKAVLKNRIEELEAEIRIFGPLLEEAKKVTSNLDSSSEAHRVKLEQMLVSGAPSFRDEALSPDYGTEFDWQSYLKANYDLDTIKVLEIGSRNVTGSGYAFEGVCSKKNHTGFDIGKGENVDVVGDAHRLSEFFDAAQFDVVYSAAVFEHIAMPWVLAEEISKVLKVGGTVITATHFAYSEHELPWHFFQFNKGALRTLFCPALGFEEIQCEHYLPMVGRFADGCSEPLRGAPIGHLYCSTHNMSRKTRESVGLSTLGGIDWRAALKEVYQETNYPNIETPGSQSLEKA